MSTKKGVNASAWLVSGVVVLAAAAAAAAAVVVAVAAAVAAAVAVVFEGATVCSKCPYQRKL